MFRKVGVPVFGMIENMSVFVCPHCGHKEHIFGHDGARCEAEKIGCDFLGAVPLHPLIRETSDLGTPVTATDPDSEYARTFLKMASLVREKLAGAH
jgi:ATP-binding protein involved in chromosome partitioning